MNFLTSQLNRLLSARSQSQGPKVAQLIANKNLSVVFQPIVGLQDGAIHAYEALARINQLQHAAGSADALFDAAKLQHQQKQLELACLELAIEQWAKKTNGAQLSLNMSAATLVQLEHGPQDGALLQLIDNCRLPARVLTLEVTHFHKGISSTELSAAVDKLRKQDVRITFDDFRCTESHMKLWSKMTPGVVKMNMELTQGIATDAAKQRRVRALVAMSKRYGSRLAAKGIESVEDICALNEAGVDFGQGYFLGSPDANPAEGLNLRARQALESGWGPIDVSSASLSAAKTPAGLRH
jgi:EAL domain-containing protein (putative c-di-GMP-specific phosphodiesterase class I)